jgi:hypothetical protein
MNIGAYELVILLNGIPKPALLTESVLPAGVPADWIGQWRIEDGMVLCDTLSIGMIGFERAQLQTYFNKCASVVPWFGEWFLDEYVKYRKAAQDIVAQNLS